MIAFTISDATLLGEALANRGVMSSEEAGILAVALSEIRDETEKLFSELLPQLIAALKSSGDLKDLAWDVQESCSHIHHHAQECKLPDYSDPWVHLHGKKES
jgi:hypothetical protein